MDNKNTKKTILVIEDNLLNMKLAGDLLEAANSFKVIKAYDGKSAFEILKKIKSDERTKAVKVVIMTALVMKEDEERIAASGCDAYIPKPINTREFVKIINAILR